MKRSTAGRYQTSTVGGEAVRAYVPSPLPPEPPIALGARGQMLTERATLAVGRLDAIAALVPDPAMFLYSYVRREALLSSQIEGTRSSFSDLLLFELEEAPGVPFDDVAEVSNYVAAMAHGMARLREGFPLSNRLIREVHAILLSGGQGADKLPGEFRRSQNWIGGTRPGTAHFVPPPADLVEECMASLERFLHAPPPAGSTLIQAALAHVQFETIQPFSDGNGRVGRLLVTLILHAGGILGQPLLYLSHYLKQHRGLYYELLDRVRVDGDWETWLEFFLEGVEQTASGAVATAQRLQTLFHSDEARLRAMGRSGAAAVQVHQAMLERPLATINAARLRASVSYPTAAKGMTMLVELGIARELTGRQRDRVFVYDKYLAILNEGAEPL